MVLKIPLQGEEYRKMIRILLRKLGGYDRDEGVSFRIFKFDNQSIIQVHGFYPTRVLWEQILQDMQDHEYGAEFDGRTLKLLGNPPPIEDGNRDGKNIPLAG